MLNILAQIISFRCLPWLSLLKSIFVGFGFGLFSILILEYYAYSYLPTSTVNYFAYFIIDFIIFSSLGYGFFLYVVICETAIRTRLLKEIYESKRELSLGEIHRRYNARKMVEMRVNRLVNSGQIICSGGKYYIGNNCMLLFAKMISTLRLIVFGKK